MTVSEFRACKGVGDPLVCVTAYDAPFARLAERAGVDALLVGDSVGRTVLGYENELPVRVDDIIHHAAAVTRAVTSTLVIADLPYMSYPTRDTALRNAARLLQAGGATAVKLEGGRETAEVTEALTSRGFPVMAHVGLTPQSAHALGGYRVQGVRLSAAQAIVDGARAQADAGAFAIVLELLPAGLARAITGHLDIPTIGIGAGPHCDGQIQVLHDLFGFAETTHRHTRVFADVAGLAKSALADYARDVRRGAFPAPEQNFKGNRGVLDRLKFD
ncbi:MAG: 3-methyl-2-oxobutanoate hydroxymethyltransferase [Chloroflexota bacterium]|nr:3-methyl-2-oxobutanoate hydroxymethyltransferase [Chloroflexota bacterium]MDE2918691.1 3-methyl-2-oxobutanoate hydroxymethyltransferase [Chloroflexota bacterium]